MLYKTHTNMCVYIHIYIYIYIHACIHIQTYTYIYVYYPNSLAMGFLMAVLVIYPCIPGFLVVRVPNRVPRVPKGA